LVVAREPVQITQRATVVQVAAKDIIKVVLEQAL
jgi:hypothetical protein